MEGLNVPDKDKYLTTLYQKDKPCFVLSLEYLKTAQKKMNNMNTNRLIKELTKGSQLNGFSFDDIGDDHLYTGLETPMKPDAFVISDEEKKEKIAILFKEIMDVMGLDLTDDSLKGTPKRVAKMYICLLYTSPSPRDRQKSRMPSSA